MFKPFRGNTYILLSLLLVFLIWLIYRVSLMTQTPSEPVAPTPRPHVVAVQLDTDTTLDDDLILIDTQYDALIEIAKPGLTLDCAGHLLSGSAKVIISVSETSGVTVRNCRIKAPGIGIQAMATGDLHIENVQVSSDKRGIFLANVRNATVTNSRLYAPEADSKATAIETYQGHEITIEKNDVTGYMQGVLFTASSHFTARENRIDSIVETGIGTFNDGEKGTRNGTIENNTISHCLMGMEIYNGSTDIVVRSNRISDCATSVVLEDSGTTDRYLAVTGIVFENNVSINNGTPQVNLRNRSEYEYLITRF